MKEGDELLIIDLETEMIVRPVKKEANLADLIGKFQTEESFDAVKEYDNRVSGSISLPCYMLRMYLYGL